MDIQFAMTRTKLFLSNRTQAVRLPKDVAFPADVAEVTIRCAGRSRIVSPVGATWDDFFSQPGMAFPDRDQPAMPERDVL